MGRRARAKSPYAGQQPASNELHACPLLGWCAGVLLVMLVLSMQSDWNEPPGKAASSAARTGQVRQLKEGVQEKVGAEGRREGQSR